MSKLKKELMVLSFVFLVLAIGMHHKQWLSHPIEHLLSLPQAGAYGVGFIHPLVFSLLVYALIYPFRFIFRKRKKASD